MTRPPGARGAGIAELQSFFPLYKYTKKEFARSFFKDGTLRIGTLHDYASSEKFAKGIYDRHEGYYFRSSVCDGVASWQHVINENNYLFCASRAFEPSLFAEFDADCCYRIDDIRFLDRSTGSCLRG